MPSLRIPITDYELSHYIPIPVDGALPVKSTSGPGMSVKAEWSHHLEEEKTEPIGEVFVAGTIYEAVITIKIVDTRNYHFDEASLFRYSELAEESQDEDVLDDPCVRKITVVYPPTEDVGIKQAVLVDELSHYIPLPVGRAQPVKSASEVGMSIKAEWFQYLGEEKTKMEGSVFVAGTIYEAAITIAIVDIRNYYFGEASHFGYFDDAVKEQYPQESEENPYVRKITVVYKPAEDVSIKQPVSDYELSHYIPIPVGGEKPVQRAVGPGMSITAKWSQSSGQGKTEMEGSVFVAGTTYEAEITITADFNYYFDENEQFHYSEEKVQVEPADPPDPPEPQRIVRVTYPPAIDMSGKQVVQDYDLQHYVPIPALGIRPTTNVVRGGIIVEVEWKLNDTLLDNSFDKFDAGKKYEAVITLEVVNDGYLFDVTIPFEYRSAEVENLQVENASSSKWKLTVRYKEAVEPPKIKEIDLTDLVPAPVTGHQPKWDGVEAGTYYSDKISWMAEGYDMPPPPTVTAFLQNTTYSAKIDLTPRDGYDFDSKEKITVVYPAVKTFDFVPATEPKILRVVITFPKTGLSIQPLFSGDANNKTDSAIDLIRGAKGQNNVTVSLTPVEETLEFDSGKDIGAEGLILDSSTNSPANVTIEGNGIMLDLTGAPSDKPLITVRNGVSLTLKNITLKGLENNNAPVIKVENGGTLTMDSGTWITENVNEKIAGDDKQVDGGGVHVNGGRLFMNTGAKISYTAGGGVVVKGEGLFTMNGGDISANDALSGGGGVYVEGGGTMFTMNGGNISGNKALLGGGVYVGGGGIFKMNDGKITGNNRVNQGGGVYIVDPSSRFTMEGGTIDQNKASEGGGVFVEGEGAFSMDYTARILKNEAIKNGGGVKVNSATFTIEHTGIISENMAVDEDGGGVYVSGGGTFTMKGGGTISGNRVMGMDRNGGGVYVGADSKFIMDRGSISGNVIYPEGKEKNGNGKGVGVYVDIDGEFTKTGGTIHGLVQFDNEDWENDRFQNYYQQKVPQQRRAIEDEDWEETPGGPGKGYAVYYKCDGTAFRFRDKTLPNEKSLSTDDLEGEWEHPKPPEEEEEE